MRAQKGGLPSDRELCGLKMGMRVSMVEACTLDKFVQDGCQHLSVETAMLVKVKP